MLPIFTSESDLTPLLGGGGWWGLSDAAVPQGVSVSGFGLFELGLLAEGGRLRRGAPEGRGDCRPLNQCTLVNILGLRELLK